MPRWDRKKNILAWIAAKLEKGVDRERDVSDVPKPAKVERNFLMKGTEFPRTEVSVPASIGLTKAYLRPSRVAEKSIYVHILILTSPFKKKSQAEAWQTTSRRSCGLPSWKGIKVPVL
uniref:Uncharacterized protein n=1 Tax=Romanomermis culicivorax TaxID=13658 RepID=A0A915JZR4_ROMCU